MSGGLKNCLFNSNSKPLQYLTKLVVLILAVASLSAVPNFAEPAWAQDQKKPNIMCFARTSGRPEGTRDRGLETSAPLHASRFYVSSGRN